MTYDTQGASAPLRAAPQKRKRWLWWTIGVVVIGIVLYASFGMRSPHYHLVPVTQGTITELVQVTGNTTPIQSLDLGFQNGGTIAAVNVAQGQHVQAGTVLETLDTASLKAQLAQAQANAASAQAQLANLQAGAQPASIQSSQAAVAGGEQTLANMYANVTNTLNDAYAKANDAVRNQLASFFSNPETSNPQLTFGVSNSQTVNTLLAARVQASAALNIWQNEIAGLSGNASSSTLDAALTEAAHHLAVINGFLADASQAVLQETGLSASTNATYNADVTNAITEANTATGNINTAMQTIASQKITIQQLQAQLALTLAGATPQQIQSQEAQVAAAQASVANIEAQIAQATLASPISGVVTAQNAKVGEIASPGEILTSILSDSGFEVDAEVPETDIGKVAIGDPVSMVFNAFPDQTFTGKVFYIDPAQTLQNGVVDYLVKVSLDGTNQNLSEIKSGLTANLNIETKTVKNALILPQYAVIQNATGTYVEIVKGGVTAQVPVTLGIQDASGNVEIASGVTAGQQVVNIGLKQ
jgi:HlyD family secretion protein